MQLMLTELLPGAIDTAKTGELIRLAMNQHDTHNIITVHESTQYKRNTFKWQHLCQAHPSPCGTHSSVKKRQLRFEETLFSP